MTLFSWEDFTEIELCNHSPAILAVESCLCDSFRIPITDYSTPLLKKLSQGGGRGEASPLYRASFRTAQTIERDPVSTKGKFLSWIETDFYNFQAFYNVTSKTIKSLEKKV